MTDRQEKKSRKESDHERYLRRKNGKPTRTYVSLKRNLKRKVVPDDKNLPRSHPSSSAYVSSSKSQFDLESAVTLGAEYDDPDHVAGADEPEMSCLHYELPANTAESQLYSNRIREEAMSGVSRDRIFNLALDPQLNHGIMPPQEVPVQRVIMCLLTTTTDHTITTQTPKIKVWQQVLP
jgi:hypothetical protein